MKPEFYRKVLKNGMTVILEKRKFPVVGVGLAIKTGGIHEKEQEKGISHFIEHMLYKGTKKRSSKQIADEIEGRGGEINGFTSETITAYWCKISSNHLNVALEVLTDMMKNSVFDKKEFEKERKVIFEEIKMRKDNPTRYALDQIHSFLYEKPFGIDLIGTYESMNSITREKMLIHFHEIYQPNNMILCVVGDADFSKIVEFAERNFGSKKGRLPKAIVKEKNEVKIEKRKGIDQVNMVFAYHSPRANEKESYAAMVLNTLMAGGMSSRLFSEIREKRNLAYAVKGYTDINKEFSSTLIYVGTTKEKMNEVKELILKEFRKVSKKLTEKELTQAKENIIGNTLISVEDSSNQMIQLLTWEIADGNAGNFYKFEDNIKKVTAEEVRILAKKATEKYSFFALVPE
ncbi:MAG: pitrilysin family protein [Candidatus Pacearchaeota archaeon]